MDKEHDDLLETLRERLHRNTKLKPKIDWNVVKIRLLSMPEKLQTLSRMEQSGGEPSLLLHDEGSGEFLFFDCSPESPAGRRSLCYDREALDSRKENKPEGNVVEMAENMGIELLDEANYRLLQQFGPFDRKTSSWLRTPADIRVEGGAIFGDYRYGHVFIYHNGAQSYYAARGFRGLLRV